MVHIKREFAMKKTNVFRRECCRKEVITSNGEELNGDGNKVGSYTETEDLVRESSLEA